MRIRPVLSVLTLALGMAQTPAFALDLAEAYAKARQNDPNWSAARNNYEAEQQTVNIGRGGLLPTLAISGSMSENSFKPDMAVPPATTTSDVDFQSIQYGAKLTQPLFRADAWSSYQRSKSVSSLAEAGFRSQEQQLALSVAQAYFAVLSAQETLAYAQSEEAAFARQLDQAQQRFDVGLIAITDVLEARAANDGARAGRIGAEAILSTAQENLSAIIGESPTRLAPLKPDAPLVKPTPADPDAWAKLAKEQNPDLAAAQQSYQTARAVTRESRSGFMPAVDLYASYSGVDNDVPVGNSLAFQNGTTTSYGVQANWVLFAGGRTYAASKQASYREAAAQDQLTATERQVVNNARTAFLNVSADSYRVEARKQAVASNESSLAAVQAGYEVGTRNIVDVLLTQRNLYAAKRDYANARYDYVINSLRLKSASGQLSEVDIKDLNNWLDPNANIVAAPEMPMEIDTTIKPIKKR